MIKRSVRKKGETMKCIAYNGGYKYQLKETYTIAIDLKPRTSIETEYIDLDTEGNLPHRPFGSRNSRSP